MRDAHLVICASIFANGGKPPVSTIDYEMKKSEKHSVVSTSRHTFVEMVDDKFSYIPKSIKVEGVEYTYIDTINYNTKHRYYYVIDKSNNEKYILTNGSLVSLRVQTMFYEVFENAV